MRPSPTLAIALAAGALALGLSGHGGAAAAATAKRVSFGPFSLLIPEGWSQRAVPENWSPTSTYGYESPVAQVSSAPLVGFDTGRMRPGQVIVLVFQLGSHGSRGITRLRAKDYVATPGPGGIRASQAGGFMCARGGRCFSIGVLVARPAPTGADVAAVNGILASLRARPL